MRVALISIAGQPRDPLTDGPATLAGKSLALRQLDFALAAGCERIVVLGDGAAPEAIALRHAAEATGAKFQALRDGHGLLGTIRAADDLLVLAPGLLPEAEAALTLLAKGHAVLVLPAGPGVAAGFERIDLERAWAGALIVPGGLVERLAELPPESAPAAALLRIALQVRVPDRWLSEEILTEGSWSMPGATASFASIEARWLKRNLPPAASPAPGRKLALSVLQAIGTRLLASHRTVPGIVGGIAFLLGGSVALAVYGWPFLAFLGVAAGAFLSDLFGGFARLRDAPFVRRRGRWNPSALIPWLVDAGLTTCGVLAIDGAWAHRLFPPLVLLGVLHALKPAQWAGLTALPGDRAVLALLLGVAAMFGLAEPAIMLVSLALLVLYAAKSRPERG